MPRSAVGPTLDAHRAMRRAAPPAARARGAGRLVPGRAVLALVMVASLAAARDAEADHCLIGACSQWMRAVDLCQPFCFACGDDSQPLCLSSPSHPGALCMPWHNTQVICTACGGSGEFPCAPQTAVPGGNDNICQDWLVPTTGGTCLSCGEPSLDRTFSYGSLGTITTNLCFDGDGDGNPAYCRPQYNPIGDEAGPSIGATCQECGRQDDFTCLSTTPCDPGGTEFSLDPFRPEVVAQFPTGLPANLQASLDAAAAAIDYCWNPQSVDFSRDPPQIWPPAESPPGPRTIVWVHGRMGGGFTAAQVTSAFPPQQFGTRNVIEYVLDYNGKGADANGGVCLTSGLPCQPMRVWAVDASGTWSPAMLGAVPIDGTSFTIRQAADFLHQGLRSLPIRGEVILIAHSQGGFVARDLVHQHYDELRFRGRPIAQVIFAGHPHLGVVLDPNEYAPFLCTSLSASYPDPDLGSDARFDAQNCASGRWMIGWNAAQDRIDDQDYPQIEWDSGVGDCGCTAPGCAQCGPGQCTACGGQEVPTQQFADRFEPGVNFAALDGDKTITTDSGLGIDTFDKFWLDALAFDVAGTANCDHDTRCGLHALLSLAPDLYTDAAVCGDLDADGDVDGVDAQRVREFLAGLATLTGPELGRCAVAGSGSECSLIDVVVSARARAAQQTGGVLRPGIRQACAAAIDLTRGLVLYWPFDEGTGTTARNLAPSGPLFDGVHVGSPTHEAGVTGGALRFDGGSEYVRVADPVALQALRGVEELTLAAWVKPTADTGARGAVLNKEGEYMIARESDGTLGWALYVSGPSWGAVSTGFQLPTDTWTHVAVVFDGHAGTVSSYANGALVHTGALVGPLGDIIPALNELRAGARSAVTQSFVGALDDEAIWHRALAAAEVAELFAGAGAVPP